MIIVFGAVHRPCIVERLHSFGVRDLMVSVADPLSRKGWALARQYGMTMWLDSGAFTFWKQGKPVDIQRYIKIIKAYQPEYYFNLDVVGDAAATARNQQTLEAAGLHPIPVFHMGEPIELLVELSRDYPLIGLGGHVGRNADAWFEEVFALGLPVRYHGLGVTRRSIIDRFPLWSVDSSWWQVRDKKTGGGDKKIEAQRERCRTLLA